jgi:hypothetical protein
MTRILSALIIVILIGITSGCQTRVRGTPPDGYHANVRHGGGEISSGLFVNGKLHGEGTLTWPDGVKYVGEFRGGKFFGQGTYTYADGRKYIGDFRFGKPNGQGTFTWGPSSPYAGDQYVGEFRDSKFHGHGTWTKANGKVRSGKWANNKFIGRGQTDLSSDSLNTIPLGKSATAAPNAANIKEAKKECADLGFKAGTEKFGECVLQLTE